MGIALVQSVGVLTTATATPTLGSNITAGNLVVVAVEQVGNNTFGTPTVSGGGVSSWTIIENPGEGSFANPVLFGAISTGGTDTVTVTPNNGGSASHVVLAEFSGVGPGPAAVAASTSGSGTFVTSPTVAVPNAQSLAIFAAVAWAVGAAVVSGVGSGWTLLDYSGAGEAQSFGVAYQIGVGPGNVSTTFTLFTTSAGYIISACAGAAWPPASGTPMVMII